MILQKLENKIAIFVLLKKLRDRNTSPKAYWSLLKTFLKNIKIPCIPPIFYENDFVIDFQKKAEIFNELFAKQCTVVLANSLVFLLEKLIIIYLL